MKLTMDERVKHRVVGLAVILSIVAIILPAVLKKSNQPFDAMSRVAVRLPTHPQLPVVSVSDEKRLFKSMKVAHVKVPKMKPLASEPVAVQIASLEPVVVPSILPAMPTIKVSPVMAQEPTKTAVTQKRALVAQHPIVRSGFAVQVASFSSKQNASELIHRLESEGYEVELAPVFVRRGQMSYKVLVGRGLKREQMVQLQRQLYSQMQLRGFVVARQVG